jgi:hypothetical protein
VREITDALDGDGGADRFFEQFERRRFHLSQTMDGMWRGDFLLDPEAGKIVKRAIEAVAGPRRRSDERTPEQFRADAFLDLCGGGSAKSRPGSRRPRADITVTVDISEIERRRPEVALEVRAHAGHGLARATLDRLQCDCQLARVITDGPSQVLDVGRATRVWPTAIRRAIEARDGGCTWPGCDRPVEFCDIHHRHRWEGGGETSVGNGRCLCRYHHVLEHVGKRGPP